MQKALSSSGVFATALVWMFHSMLVATISLAQTQALAANKDVSLAIELDDTQLQNLVEALQHNSSFKVRLQAALFLGRSKDKRAFDPLVAALASDEHYTVRAAAATALSNLQNPRAISHIIKRIATESDPFVRDEAQKALHKYDRSVALPYVAVTFSNDNVDVRKRVVMYLAESPSEESRPVLVRALGDRPAVFEVGKEAILNLPMETGLGLLEAALDHRDAEVRRGAVRVLREMGTAEAAQLVLQVFERDIEADGVRRETRKALRDLRGHLDVDRMVQDALANPHKHVRGKSIKLLGVVGGDAAKKVLLESLSNPDIYLRGTAVMALAELGDPGVMSALEKLEVDPANQRILHLVRHALKQLKKKRDQTN